MWSFILFGVLVYFVVKWFRKNPYTPEKGISTYTAPYKGATASQKTAAIKKEKNKPTKIFVMPAKTFETVTETPEPPAAPKQYPQKSLKEQFGSVPCEGSACNPSQECSEPERYFCDKVIKKAIKEWPSYCERNYNIKTGKAHFMGQYTIKTPSKYRHIDFIIYGYGGKAIAVELDDYTSHIRDAKEGKHKDDLRRQNEIMLSNKFELLRFSWHDFRDNSDSCKRIILQMMGNNCKDDVNTDDLHFLTCTDIIIKRVDEDTKREKTKDELKEEERKIKDLGALCSKKRNGKWYIPTTDTVTLQKFSDWDLVQWKKCMKKGCEGRAIADKYKAGHWWCLSCKQSFSSEEEIEAYHKTYG